MSETVEKVETEATGEVPSPLNAGADDNAPAAPATWPEDWRARLAGGDEKALKRLERMADPSAVWKSYREMETKLSQRPAVPTPPGADATPEDVAAYRKSIGVPDSPAGYLEKLPDGVVIGEADKALAELFVTDMHGANASPEVVHKALGAYYKVQEQVAAERAEADAKAVQAFEDALRPEWGADYRRNINVVKGLLSSAGEDVAAAIGNARMADGTPLASSIPFVRWLLGTALELNPAATVVPGTGASAGKGIEDRIGEIEGMMRDSKSGYWKNDKLQAEYRDLLTAREKMKAR